MTPAWAFVLDGHIFYVLNDVSGRTVVCDMRTGQWHHWYTGAVPGKWNMFRGFMWRGRPLAVDEVSSKVWEVDPNAFLDEGVQHILRVVTGFQAVRGKASMRQGSLRLTASVGEPDLVGAVVSMRFSDNEGVAWSTPQTRVLAAGDYAQPLRFRSLGRLRAPGRIWEISDQGGLVTIEGADSDMEGK